MIKYYLKPILYFLPLLLFYKNSFAQYRLNFDGYGDYVEFNISDMSPPWTYETWVHRNDINAYSQLMTSTDGSSGIRLEQYINTSLVGCTKAGVADYTFSGNYEAPVGAWVHLAVVCTTTNMELYINGVSKGTINGTINLPMGSISANLFGAGGLMAQVAEMRMWSKALTATDINTYMNSSINSGNPNYNQLAHYYKFSEGSGNLLHDSKGTAHGTIHGATWVPIHSKDVEMSALISPTPVVTNFSASNPITVRIANVGTDTIKTNFNVFYILDGGVPVQSVVNASTNPLAPYAYRDISFPNANLSLSNIHLFKIYHSYTTDNYKINDTLLSTSSKSSITLGQISNYTGTNGEYIFESGISKVKLSFYRPDIFRLQLAPVGLFQNNTDTLLNIHATSSFTAVTASDAGTYFKFETDSLVLRVNKNPFTFSLYKKDNITLVWKETSPLTFGQKTIQQTQSDPKEYFYGCGMQNGYFSFKNRSVKIENDYSNSWGVGAVPNPAPFFMSTKGYGMFRNTFSPGKYDFMSTLNLSHADKYFDAYYFSGSNLKNILEAYTYVTGRPFMIPRWGLEYGDADCYNKNGETTMDVVTKVAKKYRQENMPGGWILPNDGYGCGYKNLPVVNDSLSRYGFRAGLWCENPVSSAAFEVGTAKVSVYKLDVALVGPGYKSAFQSGLTAFNGIENNSNRRGFIWTVAGWAGTQRFATIWSGDQSGTWDNIKMHIPTVIGSGLSGFNCATGDVDGIFGGSNVMYVRDLQWKCFTPALMIISGWASYDKQPYIFGGNYTIYNRNALKLKMRLTPYFYSCSREANLTGVPTVRAMVLEFPTDPVTHDTTTQYQFMSGPSFLVAPVYTAANTRNGIYLPKAKWIDYWDGTDYTGPMTVNAYSCPLSKLPLFVKAGAIIPMYPEMLYDGEKPKDTLLLDLYPYGNSQFTLYEDDGSTKEYRNGAFAQTSITLSSSTTGFTQPIIANISATSGTYSGILASRSNKLDFHVTLKPTYAILNQTDTLIEYTSAAAYQSAVKGWYYDPNDRKGIAHVKTGSININAAFEVKLIYSTTAIETISAENVNVDIFPIPGNGEFNIVTDVNNPVQNIRIFNTTGAAINFTHTNQKNGKTVCRLNESSGIYFVHIQTEKGMVVRKIILEKQ